MLHEHALVAIVSVWNEGALSADNMAAVTLTPGVYFQGVVAPACFELALATLLDND